jgi:hypothetical protein
VCVPVFSPQDYELAARVLGLPVPQTPAERAAAAPLTATVIRNFYRAAPPVPGHEADGMYTNATRSLNSHPNVSQPEARNQLERRLRAGVVTADDGAELEDLLSLLIGDETLMQMFLQFLQNMEFDSRESGEFLSQQRPLNYDMPNYGGQYSVLNAPNSTPIPPSMEYQDLG